MSGLKRFILVKTKVGKKIKYQFAVAPVVVGVYYFVYCKVILFLRVDELGQMLKVAVWTSMMLLLPAAFVMGYLFVTVIELCHLIEKYDEILMKKGLLDKSLLE